jgi:bifunctional DNase/RNase
MHLPRPARLPLLLTLGALAVTAAPGRSAEAREVARSHHRGPPMVEVEVAGVLPLSGDGGSVVVLREKGRETLLPLLVGATEGSVIDQRLKGKPSDQPGTHDLLSRALDALHGAVQRVDITAVQDATFRAVLHLAQEGRDVPLDARPSDAIALALSAKAPIFAAREVVDAAGLTKDDQARLRRGERTDRASGAALGPGQKM